MGVFPLLRLLADGEFHSGQSLGRSFGLTRAAIWNRVRAIEGAGLPVFKVRGRGYRLAEPLDLIDARALEAALSECAVRFSVDLLDECESTNTALLERAHAGAPHASALVCELQRAGRGRRGSRWQSGIGTGLTFSVLWRFEESAGSLSGLSLAVGVAMVRAVAAFGFDHVQLKWPNDLLLGGQKLGGILIEVSGDHLGPSFAVIGIGLNVRMPRELSGRIERAATGLEDATVPSRTPLLARSLCSLGEVLPEFARLGFGPFRDEWIRRHAWQERMVTLRIAEDRVAEGTAAGVAEDGALLLRTARGIERFHGGELRLKEK
ncbi:MAG: biotin--[acetyl-CoA-carboxylase] ligase [Betaproteobacteria bacterium]|nr:biotin--[acetyl-CoA-carboxylase] ligase [Betaproteobacteria bacterium]